MSWPRNTVRQNRSTLALALALAASGAGCTLGRPPVSLYADPTFSADAASTKGVVVLPPTSGAPAVPSSALPAIRDALAFRLQSERSRIPVTVCRDECEADVDVQTVTETYARWGALDGPQARRLGARLGARYYALTHVERYRETHDEGTHRYGNGRYDYKSTTSYVQARFLVFDAGNGARVWEAAVEEGVTAEATRKHDDNLIAQLLDSALDTQLQPPRAPGPARASERVFDRLIDYFPGR